MEKILNARLMAAVCYTSTFVLAWLLVLDVVVSSMENVTFLLMFFVLGVFSTIMLDLDKASRKDK